MDITIHTYLIICPLVFLAGFIDSIAGGGGLISLPAYMIAGVSPHYAIGTNKLSSSLGTVVSTIRYCKNKFVDWNLAIPSIILALIGSTFGANLSLRMDDRFMKYFLLILLPVVAYFVLRSKTPIHIQDRKPISRQKTLLIVSVATLIIGAYDGFYGPGTGTFLILTYSNLAKMDINKASGNTKLVNLSSNIAALVTFILNGKIIFLLGIAAAVFSIAGNYIGSGLVLKNGYKIIRPLIFIVLVFLFIKVLLGT